MRDLAINPRKGRKKGKAVRIDLREGRKPGVFMNPRVIPTCIAFWPGEKEWNLEQKRLYVGTLL